VTKTTRTAAVDDMRGAGHGSRPLFIKGVARLDRPNHAWMLGLAAMTMVVAATVSSAQSDGEPVPTTRGVQTTGPATTDGDIDPEVYTGSQGRRDYSSGERFKERWEGWGGKPPRYAVRLVADQPPGSRPPPAEAGQGDPGHAGHEGGAQPTAPGHGVGGHMPMQGDPRAPRLLAWLGNFHPPMVNFPIGVLVAAALAEALFVVRKAPLFDHAARFGVGFAAIAGVGAAFLGWCFGGFRFVDSDPLLLIHRWLGTGTAAWLLVLFWASERARSGSAGRRLYRVMLFGGAVLVLTTGFFGGAMVYGLDHYKF